MSKKLTLILLLCFASIIYSSEKTIAISEESTVREDLKDLEREQNQIEKLMEAINDMYEEEDLGKLGLSYDDNKRIVTIHFKNDKAKDQYQEEMTEKITTFATDIGLQNVEVQWKKVDQDLPRISKKEKEREEISRKIMDEIHDSLKQAGYEVDSMSLRQHLVKIRIDESEANFNNVKDKIKTIAKNSIASITKNKFDVKVTQKSEQEKLEQQWSPILFVVSNLTERKFEEYRGFASSFKPEPLQIIIKTDLEKPSWMWKWISESDEKVNEIVSYVDEIIKVKKEELKVKEIPYEIIVRDKDNERLN